MALINSGMEGLFIMTRQKPIAQIGQNCQGSRLATQQRWKYRELPTWPVIAKALDYLEQNGDINITTVKDFVVGYLVKSLKKQ